MQAEALLDLFEFEKVIHLETRSESQIGQIEQLIYLPHNDRIIVLDFERTQDVFVFDGTGKYLFTLGEKGAGPNEHGRPETMSYDEKTIGFYSFPPQKVQLYSIQDGMLLVEYSFSGLGRQFTPYKLALLNGEMYFYTYSDLGSTAPDGGHYRVYKFKDMRFVRGYGKNEYNTYVALGHIVVFKGTIIYTGTLNGKIYAIDPLINEERVFCSFPEIAEQNRKLLPFDDYFASHQQSWYEEVFVFDCLLPVDDYLIVGMHQGDTWKFAIVDASGKILRKQLPIQGTMGSAADYKRVVEQLFPNQNRPVKYLMSGTKFSTFESGFIRAGFAETKESSLSYDSPNPKLIVYKLRE